MVKHQVKTPFKTHERNLSLSQVLVSLLEVSAARFEVKQQNCCITDESYTTVPLLKEMPYRFKVRK